MCPRRKAISVGGCQQGVEVSLGRESNTPFDVITDAKLRALCFPWIISAKPKGGSEDGATNDQHVIR